jgi:hypothetical protein
VIAPAGLRPLRTLPAETLVRGLALPYTFAAGPLGLEALPAGYFLFLGAAVTT